MSPVFKNSLMQLIDNIPDLLLTMKSGLLCAKCIYNEGQSGKITSGESIFWNLE